MDLVKALSSYRRAIVDAIGKLDQFPAELQEFAVEERRHLEAAVKQIEDRLTEANYVDPTEGHKFPTS